MTSFRETPQFYIYRPLIPVVIAVMAGIALGAGQPGFWRWGLCGALIVSLLLGFQILHKRRTLVLPLILCVLAGYLSIQPWLGCDPPEHHVVRYADKGYWKIHGVIASRPILNRGRWQFYLETNRLMNKARSIEVCGRIRVTGRGEWPGGAMGDRVSLRGRLRTIRSFMNPGGFDYERFMRFKGIRAGVYASANSLEIESSRPSVDPIRTIHLLGERLSSQIDQALVSHQTETLRLLKALILGQRDQITPDLRENFSRAGVGHVLAISGLHVGMVAAFFFALATWIFSVLPLSAKSAWVRNGAALVSIGAVSVYGVLAGLSPSTQRAILMVAVILLGLWIGRRHDWLNTLALAALVIVVIYPPALLSISFQLSFSALAAIIAGTKLFPMKRVTRQSGFRERLKYRFLAFFLISSMAIVGTLPLVLRYFNQASVVGPAMNLIVVPLVGFVVLPAGLLGAAIVGVNCAAGHFAWHIAAWGADLICWSVRMAASWPWAAVHTVTPSAVELILCYLWFLLWVLWKRIPYRPMIVIILTALCLLDMGYWIQSRFGRTDLRVTALDVGQASANLLELPGGYTILVDGGGFSDNSLFDVGARVLAPILWRKKIRTVDLVVLTHPNSDHLNGLLYIIEHFNVVEVWSNHEPAPTKGYKQWIAMISARKIHHIDFDQLPRRVVRQGVVLEILSPPVHFIQKSENGAGRDLNNNSLVLRVGQGRVSFLFTGDIMAPAESDLVARIGAQPLKSNVLVVPHHGSRSSSTNAFLRAVTPVEAIISAGWKNRFKFPHREVVHRLESKDCRIWCTAESGAVEVTTDGRSYSINTFRSNTP